MSPKEKLTSLLSNTKVFSENIQKKVGRDRAIVYSVYLLESNNIDATFQRTCVVSSKLFPESFSFSEFPEYPDSRIVRNCLWHCVYKSKGWLAGSDKTKYTISEKGKEIIEIFTKLLHTDMDTKSLPFELQLKGVTKKAAVTKPQDSEVNFLKEIKESKGYIKFKNLQFDISSSDIKKSLGGDRYSQTSHINNKLLQAIKYSEMTGDKEIQAYLNWIKANWDNLVGE